LALSYTLDFTVYNYICYVFMLLIHFYHFMYTGATLVLVAITDVLSRFWLW